MNNAQAQFRSICVTAGKELKEIERLQEREYQRLSLSTEVKVKVEEKQDLGSTLRNTLVENTIAISPADYSSLKDYGDSSESTHQELNEASDRCLLGVRGLEAV
jgi:hypothetical protein